MMLIFFCAGDGSSVMLEVIGFGY